MWTCLEVSTDSLLGVLTPYQEYWLPTSSRAKGSPSDYQIWATPLIHNAIIVFINKILDKMKQKYVQISDHMIEFYLFIY